MDLESPVPYDSYDTFRAQIRASILWLMSKAYRSHTLDSRNGIPIPLLEPFLDYANPDDQSIDYQFKPIIIRKLTSAEYYRLCLSHIYSDPDYMCLSHSGVVDILVSKGIFREHLDSTFSESVLSQTMPFQLDAHMAIIAGLMRLYIEEVLKPTKVAEVCNEFTPVTIDEIPENSEDAAIFWINKSCQRKKQEILLEQRPMDDMNTYAEPHGVDSSQHLPGENDLMPLVPLEDLNDISDGCSLATLISLYCPNDFSWQEIIYNNQDSMNDSIYNLKRIQQFCYSLMPYNICFLSIEDLLYVESNIRINVLAFIADLMFEFVIQPCDLVIKPEPIDVNRMIASNCINNTYTSTTSVSTENDYVNIEHIYSDANENGFDKAPTQPETDQANQKGFYISFDDDKKVKPKPASLKPKRKSSNLTESIKSSNHTESIKSSNHTESTKSSNHTESIKSSSDSPSEKSYDKVIEKSQTQMEQLTPAKPASAPNPEAFVIGTDLAKPNHDTEEQMAKKKEAIMLLSLKRRAEQEAKRVAKENELARQKEEATLKRERSEQRKLENKQRREIILDQYRQRKLAEEAEKDRSGLIESTKNLSQSTRTINPPNSHGKNTMSCENTMSIKAEYSGPKLFAKPTSKTNVTIVQNAIAKALEGTANAKTLKRMQETIERSKECKHFLILFRDRQQFRGLYDYDSKTESIVKLDGIGPKSIKHEDINEYYKFDSPKRQFTKVHTKHLSLTITAISIHDYLWPKIIHNRGQ